MFRFDQGAAELAGLIASEKEGSPGPFGVALEHIRTLPQNHARAGGRRGSIRMTPPDGSAYRLLSAQNCPEAATRCLRVQCRCDR